MLLLVSELLLEELFVVGRCLDDDLGFDFDLIVLDLVVLDLVEVLGLDLVEVLGLDLVEVLGFDLVVFDLVDGLGFDLVVLDLVEVLGFDLVEVLGFDLVVFLWLLLLMRSESLPRRVLVISIPPNPLKGLLLVEHLLLVDEDEDEHLLLLPRCSKKRCRLRPKRRRR